MAQKRQIASHAGDKGNNCQTRTRQQKKWPAGQERYVSRHWAAELTRFLCLKPCRASNLLKLRSIRPRPLPRIVRVSFSVYPRHLARRAPCDQHDAPIQLREHTHRRPILSPLAFFCESFHLQSSTAVSVTTSMTPISLPIVYQCKRQCASGVESMPQEGGV